MLSWFMMGLRNIIKKPCCAEPLDHCWRPEVELQHLSALDNFETAYSISIKYLFVCTQNIATGKNTGSSNICTPLNFKR